MTGQSGPEQLSLDRPITTPGQLLVEGRVPEMFFREMIVTCNIEAAVEVRTFGDISKDNLQTYLELIKQKPAFKQHVKRLGIIRDAEAASADSALQSVQAALRGAQLPAPSVTKVLEGSPVEIGVFILPNCRDSGMLEELCLAAVAETEREQPGAVLPCVEEFFACLEERGKRPANLSKARFAGYALARDIIDPQLGRAAQKGVIPWKAKAFDPLRAFVCLIAGTSGSSAS